ncbi:teichoic acid biosynthesis protein [Staphylococcus piscifermentans]|uniref:Glycosyltransferase 2-like domain-containing protein n=3 Tax=Staphylococcus piscifermentans TaxID=70258 RepID=A0A239TIK4_9STAP|nr:bifunctional glycosyltransferase/CDP-glycerol:glycerophosphate glycerophosphotransferase [Staphylococcus piscifermentans]GEP84536.1 hypothetical protein SPI02_11210 [Staphylococcus piscifermentans]SNU97567.1 teichoic acid biosynthesis protein [Staphylococcus piscifermentans]
MYEKLLSIIVPVYNVQGYLHDCIKSLLEQNLDDNLYEIILINDGSQDGSGKIINHFSEMHSNVKAYHFENSGLGATRNKGIELAQGKYIAFLDSDDFVPKNAYSSLLDSAFINEAEIVTGPVERFENNKYSRSGLHKKVDFTEKINTNFFETPSLVYDSTSTNKIYKSSFLKENQIVFPENIVYEDIYFTMKSFSLAKKINIIPTVTYVWRIRTGESVSISQDRFNIQGYKDRVNTCLDTLSFLKEHASKKLCAEFEKKVIVFDLPLFFPEYTETNKSYTKEFIKITRKALTKLDKQYIQNCDYRKQAIYYAIQKKDYKTVLNYSVDKVKTMQLGKHSKPSDKYLKNYYLKKITFNHSDILKTKVKKATFKDNSISINVKITSSLLDTIDEKCLSAFIYNDNENKEIQIRKKDERLYEIKIPTEIIPTTNHSSLNKIKLIYQDGDLYNEKVLSEPGANSKATTVNKKTEKWSYKLDYTFSWELYISKENITNVFDNLDIQDNNLIIKAAHIDPNSQFKLKNFREKPIIGEVHGDEIVFNLNDFEAIHRLFELEVSNNGVQTRNFKFSKIPFYSSQIKQDETHEYVIRVYNNHSFTLNRKGRHSNVLEMRKNNRDLLIRFESPYDLDVSLSKVFLSLKSTNGKVVKKFPADIIDKNTCQVAIPLETDNINYFVTYGEFVFSVDYYLNNKLLPSSLLLNASRKVKFPFSFTYKNRKYDFSSKNGNLIYLYKKQIWDKVDNTRQKRKRNYKYLYPLFRLLPKNKKKVIYYSYWGDQYSCSPKAVYETLEKKYPKYKNIWIMNDVNLPIKGNGQVVKKNSLKYWFHLATAKYFIQNTNMPVDYKKRRGQKEVQTFHGTFMKTMGFDTPEFKFETRQNKIDQFQKKINNWDYVSVPSDYMTSKARSAFNTNVKSIPSGFPRNDMIFDALNHTESIKKSLNIPSNKKIILYAPTWREGKSSDIKLDIENMQKQLGNDFILLVRAHYMVSNNMDIRQYYPFAINVSNYPSIEELYAISDVLITDYSSVMFDYAYLKRPMLFYAYDLEKYLYSERGTYLDYEKIVPGPVIRNTDALIDELQNLNSLNSRYKDKYQQFYDEFCQYGRDGDASETVIKTLFK